MGLSITIMVCPVLLNSHHVMTPMEFMQRLAALVPRPRLHLIRFHGVLAPNAKLRKAVVPVPPTAVATPAQEGDGATKPAGSAQRRMRWAQLLKRGNDIATSTSSIARTVVGNSNSAQLSKSKPPLPAS